MTDTDPFKQLRRPFPSGTVGKLPRNLKKEDRDRGQCKPGFRNRDGYPISADGHYCGGYHARSIHLDYVGHAAVTDRLLEVDPGWTWEPAAVDQYGSPALDKEGNLWIRLTVAGVTRLGVGDGPNMKERIGDAIRNAAMRFGVALDLWSKEELESGSVTEVGHDKHAPANNTGEPTGHPAPQPDPALVAARRELERAAQRHGTTDAERWAVVDQVLAEQGKNRETATAEDLRAAVTALDTGNTPPPAY